MRKIKVNIREDSVEIEGYVNAIERNSKPLVSRMGKFVERICKGAFKKALERNDDVHVLLNHEWDKDLGSTKKGNLDLEEDNIGLRARATITDKEVIEKARNNELVGWSFGFTDVDVDTTIESGMPTRAVKDLDLKEVSILDRNKIPAYEGNLILARNDKETVEFRGEPLFNRTVLIEENKETPVLKDGVKLLKQQEPENIIKEIDYSKYEKIINEMKGF